ncbi:MAG TPA: response regulator [Acidothermaceae bacterium]
MITTLVIDDDYRVARIHAASIDRVTGFRCIGEAHNAAEARAVIARDRPDLLLLDVYLPDEDGISLLRSLGASDTPMPDCIVVTAARDMQVVTAARQAGALYYLVKPFGFERLRGQLENYRRWRAQLTTAVEADQTTVDTLFHPPSSGRPRTRLPLTMQSVLDNVRSASRAVTAVDVAQSLGISRATAQRYLSELGRQGLLQVNLEYRASGRPLHHYRTTS